MSATDLPRLKDILYKKSLPPVCLYNYYVVLRDRLQVDTWLDFWLDVTQAMALHKRYIKHTILPTVERASPELLTHLLLTYHDNQKQQLQQPPSQDDMESTVERIYQRYIAPKAEKEIHQLPESIRQSIASHFEPNAKRPKNPVIYREAKRHVLELLETTFPLFIKYKVFMNMTLSQQIGRFVLGFFLLLFGFSMELTMIFLKIQPWQKRLWGILPIGSGIFCTVTSITGIDPIWVLFNKSVVTGYKL